MVVKTIDYEQEELTLEPTIDEIYTIENDGLGLLIPHYAYSTYGDYIITFKRNGQVYAVTWNDMGEIIVVPVKCDRASHTYFGYMFDDGILISPFKGVYKLEGFEKTSVIYKCEVIDDKYVLYIPDPYENHMLKFTFDISPKYCNISIYKDINDVITVTFTFKHSLIPKRMLDIKLCKLTYIQDVIDVDSEMSSRIQRNFNNAVYANNCLRFENNGNLCILTAKGAEKLLNLLQNPIKSQNDLQKLLKSVDQMKELMLFNYKVITGNK